jgi:hypothetical protein
MSSERSEGASTRAAAVSLLSMMLAAPTPASETIVLRAARILDGRGGQLEDKDIVVREGRIAATGEVHRVPHQVASELVQSLGVAGVDGGSLVNS